MKKKLLKLVSVVIFGIIIGYTTYYSQKKNSNLSNLLLDNIEALAGEGGAGIDWNHHKRITKNGRECCESGWAHYTCSGSLNQC